MTAPSPDTPPAPAHARFQALDLLATLVAVVTPGGEVLFANAALEDALGSSRRTIEGSSFPVSFTDPQLLRTALVPVDTVSAPRHSLPRRYGARATSRRRSH